MSFKCLQFSLKDQSIEVKDSGCEGRIYCAKEIYFFLLKYERAKFYLADFLPLICIFSFNSPGKGLTTVSHKI